ncbi:Wadjet anti-phage system protein JetD domain-containing protein [Flavobacterium sp. FlaQc-47]|uniref:Wadjet anti-phage system protein JetD domain-containing protein n=1 Tax=Flavobacterium sp. FlaQc-47 TaxID=3374180 RepID=UPI0037577C15
MISPSEIKTKAGRKYLSFLQSMLEEKPFTELVIRGDKNYTKSSLSEFEKEILLLISQSKEKKGFGYTLDFQKVKTKYLGTQDLPITIYFETETDLLKYLGKEKEAELFKVNCEKIIFNFPELRNWVIQNPSRIIQNQNEWESILKVCIFFKQNPKPNLYVRELPISVHTKFVERNQAFIKDILDELIPESANTQERQFEKRFNLKFSEPLVRFKILEKEISRNLFSGLDDIAIPVSQFEKLNLPVNKVIIVENKTTLYTTLTLPRMNKTIAIFGSGYSVSNLKNVNWFKNLELLYWGDIDVHGFEILSQFRGYFPHTQSRLMDKQTFDRFFENDLGTVSNITRKLNLTHSEQELYTILKLNNWRLEQEKIPFDYVNKSFENE